jgi:ELWxxDGT repeat protein
MGTYNNTAPFPDPGSSTSTALDTSLYIGGSLLSTPSLFQDDLSGNDNNDYYKFTLGSSSSSIVNLELDGLASDADIILRNNNPPSNNFLYSSRRTGTANERIRVSLSHAPGNIFYTQVFLNSGQPVTAYNLRMSAEAIQNRNILDNSTTEAATNNDLGTFSTTTSIGPITDFVGSTGQIVDTNDYYKFTIAPNTTGTVNVALNSLNGTDTLYADLELFNSSNTVIARSNTLGTTSDSVSLTLGAGTYYIRAYSQADPGNYNLQFNFTADALDQGGNTLATASSINLPATISDVVSSADTSDYYKFTLGSTGLVDIKFTSLTADANITLQNENGTATIQSSNLTGTALDTIRLSLNPGTYNILVNRGTTATAQYTLSVSAETINPDTSGNSISLAKDLGTLTGSAPIQSDFVGNIDTNDYYKFTLASFSSLSLNLDILSNYSNVQLVNADVQILNSNGSQVAISNQTGNSDESINTTLNAGTYYVRVYTSGLANTFYNLDLTAQPEAKLVQDINPNGNSNPANLTALGNLLYFTADDGVNGIQLLRSDGTTTTSLSNISNFDPNNLIVFNNKLYFTASNSTFGRELWEFNGTSLARISDINVGAGNSNPGNLTVVGNKLFFTSVDSSSIRKLWFYDGTSVNLVDVNPGFATTSTPTFTTAFNNRLFFSAKNNSQLWSTDGTIAGTQVITAGGVTNSTPRSLTVVGTNLYFTANDGTSGQEIWQYQSGTTASLLKDITLGNNSYAPERLTAVGNTLYFVTDSDNDFNLELWKSDGTAAGTAIIGTDGQPPNLGLGSIYLTAVGNTLYLVANDPTSGLELWKTDGTVANIVKDISSGSPDSLPTSLVNFNGTLAFAASDGISREVWFSDGTESNTLRVSNIAIEGNADPKWLTVVGNKLFFTANGANGTELYVI